MEKWEQHERLGAGRSAGVFRVTYKGRDADEGVASRDAEGIAATRVHIDGHDELSRDFHRAAAGGGEDERSPLSPAATLAASPPPPDSFFEAEPEPGLSFALKRFWGAAINTMTLDLASKEVGVLRGLRHSNIARVVEVFGEGDHLCAVMPLATGGSLEAALDLAGGVLRPEEVLHVGLHVADALSCVHAGGVVHQDVKPSNLLLMRRAWGEAPLPLDMVLAGGLPPRSGARVPVTACDVLLSDFGTAVVLAGTTVLGPAGTVAYMPPEVLRDDGEPITPAADMWSYGATLLRLATGARLAEAVEDRRALRKGTWSLDAAVAALPSSGKAGWAGLSEGLQGLIRSCLQLDPSARPSAASLLELELFRVPILQREVEKRMERDVNRLLAELRATRKRESAQQVQQARRAAAEEPAALPAAVEAEASAAAEADASAAAEERASAAAEPDAPVEARTGAAGQQDVPSRPLSKRARARAAAKRKAEAQARAAASSGERPAAEVGKGRTRFVQISFSRNGLSVMASGLQLFGPGGRPIDLSAARVTLSSTTAGDAYEASNILLPVAAAGPTKYFMAHYTSSTAFVEVDIGAEVTVHRVHLWCTTATVTLKNAVGTVVGSKAAAMSVPHPMSTSGLFEMRAASFP